MTHTKNLSEAAWVFGSAILPKDGHVDAAQKKLLEEVKRDALLAGFEVKDEPRHELIVIIDPQERWNGIGVGFEDSRCFVMPDSNRLEHTTVAIAYHALLDRFVGTEHEALPSDDQDPELRGRREGAAVVADAVVKLLRGHRNPT